MQYNKCSGVFFQTPLTNMNIYVKIVFINLQLAQKSAGVLCVKKELKCLYLIF